ncbi:alpha/beta hydrolase [Listeria sp. FSL L7-1509]|uniref:Alpha/beta hydrolase n=1 Tax=Listeria immobilis TaxID=2713502 RepID=A0ABR6SWY6_9LIST|nr:alpha/beta hydrolase [Listeria immobilis]MBC1482852.1 alpha/beta hydrolase [Listeria immobilis]MBC1506979.1 alpha/beta hydrolase [Listeria immobilis]MBC1510190.1 alpha/beta hydrolase [Listeria immobilis]MBC6303312.1 alpha/beta hydrolase [Listeria immobilis]MBC6312517.1 alpha/beta hydrolase [Listeria immobilis]
MKKILIISGSILIGLLLIITISASFYLYSYALARDNTSMDDQPTTDVTSATAKLAKKNRVENQAWMENQKLIHWTEKSSDNLKLEANYLEATQPSNTTIILAHGYRGKSGKVEMAGLAKMYHEKFGYNVLMPDARAHGESEGENIGFGWPERKDYVQWINQVIDRNGEDETIALHGVSMGSSTVLMTSGENLPKQVKSIIADCGYTSMDAELSYQLKAMFHLPSFPIIPTASLINKFKEGFYFSEASATNAVAKTDLPIFYIHGDKDAFVPTYMVDELYEATNSYKEKWIVKGAEHGQAFTVDPTTYEEKVRQFLNKTM